MTVNTTNITSGPYSGDGATTGFAFTFRVDSAAELVVYLTAANGATATLLHDTHYTLAGLGVDAGGTVNMVTAPASGETVYMRASHPHTQLTEFASQGGFFPTVHEAALDKLTFHVQQLQDQVDRSAKRALFASATVDMTLPEPVAGNVLGWDATGTGLDNADVSNGSVTFSTNLAENVQYTPSQAGTVVRTAAAKHAERISVKDFGAIGDGVDDTAALAAVATYVNSFAMANHNNPSPTLITVEVPDGTYRVTSDWLFTGPVNIVASAGATLVASSCSGLRIAPGAGNDIYGMHLELPVVVNESINWSNGKHGVQIENARDCHILVREIYGFHYGLTARADGRGWVYNETHFGRVANCRFGLNFECVDTATSGTTGWANENTWYGGKFEIRAGALSTATYSPILIYMPAIDGIALNGPNRNVFIRPTCENVDPNVTKISCHGNENLFISPRLEDAGLAPGSFDFGTTSRANVVAWCEISSGDAVFNDQGTGNVIQSFRGDSTGKPWTTNAAVVQASNIHGDSRPAIGAKPLGTGADVTVGMCGDGSLLWPSLGRRLSWGGDTISMSGGSKNGFAFNYWTPLSMTSANCPNGSAFVDSADNKLKFKDSGGTVRLLY